MSINEIYKWLLEPENITAHNKTWKLLASYCEFMRTLEVEFDSIKMQEVQKLADENSIQLPSEEYSEVFKIFKEYKNEQKHIKKFQEN